ncbi:MAG: HAD-IIIA family hydrolase [Crocinitomicaceae bacterium]
MSIKSWGIDNTWSLFLDRDGVINKRIFGGYITSIEEFEFLPGVEEAIVQFSKNFHLVLVVTNQQGIAKGIMSERNLLEIHNYMCDQIYLKGGRIDKCYFAPNLKGADDDMRKPCPVMAELAKMEYTEIDFKRCVMIGDADTDIEFGKNLGMKTVRIKTDEPINLEADLTLSGLDEFAKMIENEI